MSKKSVMARAISRCAKNRKIREQLGGKFWNNKRENRKMIGNLKEKAIIREEQLNNRMGEVIEFVIVFFD